MPAADIGTQVSQASSDNTGEPDYPSDVTEVEYSGNKRLKYTPDNGVTWYNFEGSFKVEDGSTWKYWTCFEYAGPFTGTGAEEDKSARYKILDEIRDNKGANFYQKCGGVGQKVTLPP